MPYAFKVTAKQNIGGSKGIAKGMSVQCVEKSISSPQIKTILEAFKNQHGIEKGYIRFNKIFHCREALIPITR